MVTKLTGILFALTTLLDPLRAIVSSLETSSKRIEDSLTVKRNKLEKREHQLSTIHQLHCQHSLEGLVVSNAEATTVGLYLSMISKTCPTSILIEQRSVKNYRSSGSTMVPRRQLPNA